MSTLYKMDDLEASKKKIEQLVANEQNPYTRAYLKRVLDSTNAEIFEEFVTLPKQRMRKKLYYTELDLATNARYVKLIDELYPKFEPLISIKGEIATLYNTNKRLEKKVIGEHRSDEETIELAKQYYSTFDPTLSKILERYYNVLDSRIAFVDPKSKNSMVQEGIVGKTFFIDGAKDFYIHVLDNPGILKYTTTIHEIGHALSLCVNPQSRYYNERKSQFNETEAFFPELVSLYEARKKGLASEAEIAYQELDLAINVFDMAEDIVLQNIIIGTYQENNRKLNPRFIFLLKQAGISPIALNRILDASVSDVSNQFLSYAIVIELLHLYKQNPAQALKLYKDFINLPYTEDPLGFIEEEINLGEHLEEETKDTVKRLELALHLPGAKK